MYSFAMHVVLRFCPYSMSARATAAARFSFCSVGCSRPPGPSRGSERDPPQCGAQVGRAKSRPGNGKAEVLLAGGR